MESWPYHMGKTKNYKIKTEYIDLSTRKFPSPANGVIFFSSAPTSKMEWHAFFRRCSDFAEWDIGTRFQDTLYMYSKTSLQRRPEQRPPWYNDQFRAQNRFLLFNWPLNSDPSLTWPRPCFQSPNYLWRMTIRWINVLGKANTVYTVKPSYATTKKSGKSDYCGVVCHAEFDNTMKLVPSRLIPC